MAHCKSCKGFIRWIKTPQGLQIPVNPGQIQIDTTGQTSGQRITVITEDGHILIGTKIIGPADLKAAGNVVRGYTSHFATCPFEDESADSNSLFW